MPSGSQGHLVCMAARKHFSQGPNGTWPAMHAHCHVYVALTDASQGMTE